MSEEFLRRNPDTVAILGIIIKPHIAYNAQIIMKSTAAEKMIFFK
jgi:hypothetical protein